MTDDQPARLTDARIAEIRARAARRTFSEWNPHFEAPPAPGDVVHDTVYAANARQDTPALLAHIQALESALAALRRACHLPMPEGERLSQSGYVCALCLWDADPDDLATHEPTCPLFVAAAADGEAR